MKVIDFECDTPTVEAVQDIIRLIKEGRASDKDGYARNMAPGWAAQIGMSLEEFNEAKQTMKLCDLDMQRPCPRRNSSRCSMRPNVSVACAGNAGRRAFNEDVVARDFPDLTSVAGLVDAR